jgi:tetratricopeptide (TPR) repeat protein
MTRTRCTLAFLIALAVSAEAPAQFIIGVPSGIDFRYRSGGLRVRGFIPIGGYYPYPLYYPPPPVVGIVEQRVTVHVMPPPTVIVRSAAPDLSGIDLDVEPASKIWGEKPGLAKRPTEKIGEAARIELAPEKAKPKPEPVPEGRRLTELGIEAFQVGEYNVARRRFQQVADEAPMAARPLFLEAQALIAMGKYREAVEIIEQGLKRMPDWPTSGYRPKRELYDKDEGTWTSHRKQLEQAQRLHPKNADYAFLLGYLAWFDGERDPAVEHFRAARSLAPDAPWSELFLKVAKK